MQVRTPLTRHDTAESGNPRAGACLKCKSYSAVVWHTALPEESLAEDITQCYAQARHCRCRSAHEVSCADIDHAEDAAGCQGGDAALFEVACDSADCSSTAELHTRHQFVAYIRECQNAILDPTSVLYVLDARLT